MTMNRQNPPHRIPVRGWAPALAAACLTLVVQAAMVFLERPVPPPRVAVDAAPAEVARVAAPGFPRPVRVSNAGQLARLFDRLDYRLEPSDGTHSGVPPIKLVALPPDLAEVRPVDRRKRLFVGAVLPIVLSVNQEILEKRREIEAALAGLRAGIEPAPADREVFLERARRYGVVSEAGTEVPVDADLLRRLLVRIDAVPPSLAVTQAILESGWGTSRFARDGNALFGQWTWNPAAGILPAARRAGARHRVQAFDSLADSTRAYLFNLNTHPAYRDFRLARAAARAADGALPAGGELAAHLTAYSERREAYVREIRAIIRQNRLDRLDQLALRQALRVAEVVPPAGDPAGG
jgi:Bax protein